MENLVFGWKTVRIETVTLQDDSLCLRLSAVAAIAACPVCQQCSEQIHSRYERTLLDSPCCGQPLTLRVQVRRFFCCNEACCVFARNVNTDSQPT